MQTVLQGFAILRGLARKLGPYVVVELLLPGGTLLALILFLCRRGTLNASGDPRRAAPGAPRVIVSVQKEHRHRLPLPVRMGLGAAP
ncbi:MAG TPA: hypothetical protein VF059_04365 [Casimicrobiaceae bacterium]